MERRRAGSASSRGQPSPDERPTTAPPATTIQSNSPAAELDFTDLEQIQFDTSALFATSSDWLLLGRAMAVLEEQHEQCRQDIQRLEELRETALADPDNFIRQLHQPPSGMKIPKLQSIYRIPSVDSERFMGRASRRGMVKKEQNVDFFMKRLKELDQRGSVVLPVPIRSDNLTIDPNVRTPSPSGDNDDGLVSSLQKQYKSLVSPPAIKNNSNSSTPVSASAYPHSSSNPSKQDESKKKRQKTKLTTHNVPWTREEKKKLNDLLIEYPEEPVAARRYAKIAAALGTRTATQVFTRYTKLMASLKDLSGTDSDIEDQALARSHNSLHTNNEESPEYREYVKLKRALELELSGGGSAEVHVGIKCGGCNARPIVGPRYSCRDCGMDICESCFPNHVSHAAMQVTSVINNLRTDVYNYLSPGDL